MTINFQPKYESVGTFQPDRLIANDLPLVTRSIVVASGQNLARGTLLGRITASGKYGISATAASDGSQTGVAILAEDVDASDGDVTSLAYEAGSFNSGAMTFGTGHTAASVEASLRVLGIFLKTSVPA